MRHYTTALDLKPQEANIIKAAIDGLHANQNGDEDEDSLGF